MKLLKTVFSITVFILFTSFLMQCEREILNSDDSSTEMKAKPAASDETVGNNLSFPVIWSDQATKALNGNMGEHSVLGEWWYVWGEDPVDPQGIVNSCKPSETEDGKCEDGSAPGDGYYKAYVQKDADNIWQATNLFPGQLYDLEDPNSPTYPEGLVNIDWVDWGDNLESIDWSIKSQVRTEVVLYKDLVEPATEFPMRHVDSWGIDEVHGLQIDPATDAPAVIDGLGTRATVFSDNARFTIQKLNIETREEYDANEEVLKNLEWVPTKGWKDALVSDADPLFNMVVYDAEDGPGYYNAEVNVKGKIIYGYTWNLKKLNDGEGYYRLTFSFDNPDNELNTSLKEANILLPIDDVLEEVAKADDSGEGARGGIAVMDYGNNLTYMDIFIVERISGNSGGGNGGGGNGNGGNGGNGNGGGGNGGSSGGNGPK